MFLEELTAIIDRSRIKERELLKGHTTFHIGGPADYFLDVVNTEELTALLSLCGKEGIAWRVIGNGSNLLVSDAGVRGAVIRLGGEFGDIRISKGESEGTVTAGAGVRLARLARETASAGLAGLEFAGGIPGTLGGALVMNAGAYGGEMKDYVKSVVMLKPDGTLCRLTAEEMEFGYRTSVLQKNGAIALGAEFVLPCGVPEESLAKIEELNARRREKQPLEYPSAGSTFKRPEGYFAGKLIMDAGLRGYAVGGAAVSEKHCGFVINKENASAAEVCALMERVRQIVYEKAGVLLEPEVRLWGEF